MVSAKLMTVEDLEQITEVGRYDLIRGELIAMAPAGEEHGSIAFTLSTLLGPHIRSNKLGRGYTAEAGFVLRRDPDVVLAPDVAFVRTERLPAIELRPRFFDGPPDLAVEVVSPSESSTHTQEKVLEYLDAGTQLVWVIEPRRRSVTVYRADHSAQVLRENDRLDGEDVLPGFSIRVGEIFE